MIRLRRTLTARQLCDALVVVALLVVAAACSDDGGDEASTTVAPTSSAPADSSPPPSAPFQGVPDELFDPSAVWNAAPPGDAPLDPDSDALSASVARMATEHGNALSVYSYTTPVYEVGPSQPTVPVVPDVRNPSLHDALAAVPIPPDARPSDGTDAHLVVFQPSTDTMWEFWKLRNEAGVWHCGYGGRMVDVSKNPGYFTEATGPDGTPVQQAYWGATATGLPLLGGLITPEELERGEIDHALALALPEIRAGVRALPAQRSDGKYDAPTAVPEGAHFRIDPDLDLDALGLPPPTLVIAKAAQRYGMIVRDGAGEVALYAQDPANLAADPYPKLLDGLRPFEVLDGFPWDRLELLKMDLHPDQ